MPKNHFKTLDLSLEFDNRNLSNWFREGLKKKIVENSTKRITGPDDRITTRYSRATYYVCDIGPQRGGKLRQQRQSFLKTTSNPKTSTQNQDDRDINQGELGKSSTATVGQ